MYNALNIKVPANTKIAVVGDIHEHDYQFNKLLDTLQPSTNMWLVSVGDIYDKGFGKEIGDQIALQLKTLYKNGFGYVIKGNHELSNIKKALNSNTMNESLAWLRKQPLVLSFIFENGNRLTVLHGGVEPKHTWDDLNYDVATSYIRDLDEKGKMIRLKQGIPWHDMYDGRFGYIAAGHQPCKDGKPKYYNYSCNLDTACFETGILTSQVFTEGNLESLHAISGPHRR